MFVLKCKNVGYGAQLCRPVVGVCTHVPSSIQPGFQKMWSTCVKDKLCIMVATVVWQLFKKHSYIISTCEIGLKKIVGKPYPGWFWLSQQPGLYSNLFKTFSAVQIGGSNTGVNQANPSFLLTPLTVRQCMCKATMWKHYVVQHWPVSTAIMARARNHWNLQISWQQMGSAGKG